MCHGFLLLFSEEKLGKSRVRVFFQAQRAKVLSNPQELEGPSTEGDKGEDGRGLAKVPEGCPSVS